MAKIGEKLFEIREKLFEGLFKGAKEDKKRITLISSADGTLGEGRKRLEYTHISELKSEFESMGVKIGNNVMIGDHITIGYNTTIGDNVIIFQDVYIGDNVIIENDSTILYESSICSHVLLKEKCSIKERVKIWDNSIVCRGVSVKSGARIAKDSFVTRSLTIHGSRDIVSYWGQDMISIGCMSFSISWWKNRYREIGAMNRYKEEEISEYKKYIDLIDKIHNEN